MSLSTRLFRFAFTKDDSVYAWDGATFSIPADPSSPDKTRRFRVTPESTGGGLDQIRAFDESLAVLQTWDETTDPEIGIFGNPPIIPIILFNGGAESDYSYTVTYTLTGDAIDAASGFLTPGSHSGTDFDATNFSDLEVTTLGNPARWEILFTVTHTPSGDEKTGTIIIEFS